MIRIVLWRHGQTEWNATERVQGQADVDLDAVGVAQVAQAAPTLAAMQPRVIVSSDLLRAVHTAQPLAELTGVAVELDPRLRERHFGPWQGLTMAQVKQRYPDDHARWRAHRSLADPAVETIGDLAKRVVAALRDIVERVGAGTAVVVTHGGPVRVGCAGLLGWPEAIWGTLGGLGNCRVAELRNSEDRGWRLITYNTEPAPER